MALVLNGSEALVKTLESLGVEHIFGLPGDHTHFYDALFKSLTIKHSLVRHEQCAAHMADGYARETGKVGVCDAANGPGATNLVTGIAEAFTDGIPVVAIASNIRLTARGRGCFQEVDQLNIFRPITKEVIDVQAASRIPEYVRRAFQLAVTGKPGPVLLNLPLDVIRESHDYEDSDFTGNKRWGIWPALRVRAEAGQIRAALDLLKKAKRPVIWCGGGVLTAGAWEAATLVAERTSIPIATTFMGKGSIREDHDLSLGTVGQLGRRSVNEYVGSADVILAVGTRFSNLDTAGGQLPSKHATVIQVDIDPAELDRNVRVELCVWSDARLFLEELLELCIEQGIGKLGQYGNEEINAIASDWRKQHGVECDQAMLAQTTQVHPLQVIKSLRDTLGDNDVLICDSGFNQIWGGQYFDVDRPGRSYIGPRGFGVMGYSLPAAIGAKVGSPHKRFIALCGDGGFAMVIQELETSVRIGAPVVVVIMNNRNMEYIKQTQRSNFGSRFLSVDFNDVNFADIAAGFGCNGVRVRDASRLSGVIQKALESNVTTVIDVVTPESAQPDRYIPAVSP